MTASADPPHSLETSDSSVGAAPSPAAALDALAPSAYLRWSLAWIAAWLIPFGTFQLGLVPAGYGMFGTSWVSGVFFAVSALTVGFLFREQVRARLTGVEGSWPLGLFALAFALALGAAAWAQTNLPVEPETFETYRSLQIGLVRMDATYLAAKLPELCFQQTLIYVLVRRVQTWGFVGWRLIGVFALLFGGVHLPILFLKGLAGLPFLVAATGASLVFAPLIAFVQRGVFLSFSVHLLAYTAAGLGTRALS